MVRHWATFVLAALALLVIPAAARADGDPASDVLLSQPLFVPADAGVPTGEVSQLADVVRAAGRSGYPIRVALISGPADLGSVTALWRQPQTYAHFLDEELAPSYRGRVLVVMPNGIGVYRPGPLLPAERRAVASIHAPGRGGAVLAATATDAVRGLAAAAGHSLPASTASNSSGSGGGSDDLVAWIVFALGGIVIVAAWTWSLRTRPLRMRRQRPAA